MTMTSSGSRLRVERHTSGINEPRTIVILGGDETGLAVLRHGTAAGLHPVVLARPGDVSTRSRLARCVVVDEPASPACLPLVNDLVRPDGHGLLVATNDRWLRFVLAHRDALEERFTVLHPHNDVLETCLNKRRFALWARDHDVPTPAALDESEIEPIRTERSGLPFPLLIRPEWSNQVPATRVPKAVPIASAAGFRDAIRQFEAAQAPWVATRSLLAEAHAQYSVGVAVREGACVSFVAQKIRPLPARCAVGSYVALRPHFGAETLARTVTSRLGFDFGVAEVEIIETHGGELFVIEVNPRPWTQFPLSRRAGHDLLAFLLAPGRYRARGGTAAAWIDVGNDLFTCFSRSSGLVRQGQLSLGAYLRSLARVRTSSTFAWNDPRPGLASMMQLFARGVRQLF